MKKVVHIIFYLITNIISAQNIPAKTDIQNSKEIQILELVLKTLNEKHIAPRKLDDVFSKQMFKTYIDSLDSDRLFFLQSDIDEFKKFETQLDDQIKNYDLSFYNLTKKRYLLRLEEAKEIYSNVLKNKLDFTQKDIWDDKLLSKFSKNSAEFTIHWQKFIKKLTIDDNKAQISQETTKEDFEKILTSFNVTNSLTTLEKTYYNINNASDNLIFSQFLNAIIAQYDSHSKYYLDFLYKEYTIKKSGKVESFGFRFGLQNDFIVVSDIIPGGSADKNRKMIVGDVILKVAFDGGKPENAAGLTLNEFFKLISSKKANSLSFTLKKQGGKLELVTLKRSLIYKDDIFIKSGVVTKNNMRYAVVSLPKFYDELDKLDQRNTEEDFKKELIKLHSEGVNGIILDLRDNVGGTLDAAINVISNLIPEKNLGFYKQQSSKQVKIKSIQKINAWDKSVVLLVNKETASGAEFIASAFQFYNIGIIIGEKTQGNATTSETFKLNDLKPVKDDKDDLGYLEITTKTFYKPDGETLHKLGVNPAVDFENKDKNIREKSKSNSLIVNSLKVNESVKNIGTNKIFNDVVIKSKSRVEKNNVYKFYINFSAKSDLAEITTLNSDLFLVSFKALFNKYINSDVDNYNNSLDFKFLTQDEKLLSNNEKLKTTRQSWLKSLSQDFLIEQGIFILEDLNASK